MRTIRWRNPLLGLCALVVLSGCRDGEMAARISGLESLRAAASKQVEHAPYRLAQHQAFKAYFAQIESIARDLRERKGAARSLGRALKKAEFESLCARVWMPKAEWITLVSLCSRQGFFLCAEEVRAYPDLVRAFRDGLPEPERVRFMESKACREVLE